MKIFPVIKDICSPFAEFLSTNEWCPRILSVYLIGTSKAVHGFFFLHNVGSKLENFTMYSDVMWSKLWSKICRVECSDSNFIWKLIFNIYAVVLEAYGEDGDETTTTPIYADVVEREDEGIITYIWFFTIFNRPDFLYRFLSIIYILYILS